ncbi:hypothetical protein [Paenibacillus sonchi]|uniref:hypothetical protein n=1 Tax=Paenibacillus sonchi TaxID=373687 RepID=UPI001E47D4DA|nr:hypothetical protein [Paenibacillus sonchi]
MKEDDHKKEVSYAEFIISPDPDMAGLPHSLNSKEPENIVWHMETMKIDSFHEAFEWIMSGPYNELGYLYTGYKTTNWMLAHILVYERIRLNTISDPRFLVHTNYDFTSEGILYKVWVTLLPTGGEQEAAPEPLP